MSDQRLARRKFSPDFSPESVSYHKYSRDEFSTHIDSVIRQAVESGTSAVNQLSSWLFEWATDTRLLCTEWDRLSKYGGDAPGPNGKRYSDFPLPESRSFLKALSKAVRSGCYQPERAKRIWVAKDPFRPEKGDRPISLINIQDRVLQRAALRLLQLIRDPCFKDFVFGSRPNRERLHALAYLEQMAKRTGRWVWVVDDIKDAFENVPRSRLRNVLTKHFHNWILVEWILKMTDNGGKKGIQQGGPLSPFLLNEYLDHFLDQKWEKSKPQIPLIRYVDDLLILCKTKREAKAVSADLQSQMKSIGMPIKGDNPICDPRKAPVVWLGFEISVVNKELEVRIAPSGWSQLYGKLKLALSAQHSSLKANEIINGWLDQNGVCYEFEDVSAVLDRLKTMAHGLGFEELPVPAKLKKRWEKAHRRWKKIQSQAASV